MHWRHRFEPIAVQQMIKQSPADVFAGNSEDLKRGLGIHQTLILEQCECGRVQTTTIRGHWSLEQVQGNVYKGKQRHEQTI